MSDFDGYREDVEALAEALLTLSEDNRKAALITIGVISELATLI